MNYFKLKIEDEQEAARFIRANLHDGGVTVKGRDGYFYVRTRWSEAGVMSKARVVDFDRVDYNTYNARVTEGASISSRY